MVGGLQWGCVAYELSLEVGEWSKVCLSSERRGVPLFARVALGFREGPLMPWVLGRILFVGS